MTGQEKVMRCTGVLGFVLFCALASAAFAQQAAPTQGLAYFVGEWRVSARDPATGETLEMSYAVEPTAGGSWFAGAGASPDGAFNARDMWGLDPQTGDVMRVIFDGGGTFATVRARAWDGDRLVLEGDAHSTNGVVRVRETITRITNDRFEAVWAAYRDGEWEVYSVETVTRET
jgi:hypothetical protein